MPTDKPKKVVTSKVVEMVSDTEYLLLSAGQVLQVVVDGKVTQEMVVAAGKRWRGAVTIHGNVEAAT